MSDFHGDPAPHGERAAIRIDEGVVAGWRFPRSDAPRIVFSHATGFCASAYRQMLRALAELGFDVLGLDLRGHGRSELPADPSRLTSWKPYAADLGAVLDRLGGADILAGHSCGAVVSALAARGRRDIGAIALIEPVAFSPAIYAAARTPFLRHLTAQNPLARGARKRRSAWPDRESVISAYRQKPLFQSWVPGALEDYLEDGLVEQGGEVRLSCAPGWEAATYAAHAHDFWGAVKAASAPVSVLAVDHRSSTLLGAAKARFARYGADVEVVGRCTHLMPLERPQTAARFVARAAAPARELVQGL